MTRRDLRRALPYFLLFLAVIPPLDSVMSLILGEPPALMVTRAIGALCVAMSFVVAGLFPKPWDAIFWLSSAATLLFTSVPLILVIDWIRRAPPEPPEPGDGDAPDA